MTFFITFHHILCCDCLNPAQINKSELPENVNKSSSRQNTATHMFHTASTISGIQDTYKSQEREILNYSSSIPLSIHSINSETAIDVMNQMPTTICTHSNLDPEIIECPLCIHSQTKYDCSTNLKISPHLVIEEGDDSSSDSNNRIFELVIFEVRFPRSHAIL